MQGRGLGGQASAYVDRRSRDLALQSTVVLVTLHPNRPSCPTPCTKSTCVRRRPRRLRARNRMRHGVRPRCDLEKRRGARFPSSEARVLRSRRLVARSGPDGLPVPPLLGDSRLRMRGPRIRGCLGVPFDAPPASEGVAGASSLVAWRRPTAFEASLRLGFHAGCPPVPPFSGPRAIANAPLPSSWVRTGVDGGSLSPVLSWSCRRFGPVS